MSIWLPAVASFAAALLLLDCVLLAAAGLLCARGFYWAMDGAAPLTPGAGALRCLAAALALLTAALVLSGTGLTALVGWWTPSPEVSKITPMFVIAVVALPSLVRSLGGFCEAGDLTVDIIALTALMAVLALRTSGIAFAACWALLASGAFLVGVSWRLSRTVANAFLESAKA